MKRRAGLTAQGVHQIAGQSLTAHQQMLQSRQHRACVRIGGDHPRHRGGALHMRDAVAHDLGREREVIRCQFLYAIGAAQHFGEGFQTLQHHMRRDAVVDQTGHLIHADAFEVFDPRHGVLNGAEQAGVLEIALKGKIEDRFKFLGAEAAQIHLEGVVDALGFLERREGPGVLLDEPRSRAQVVFHRLARHLAGGLAGVSQIGVQHERDGEIGRIMPRLAQCRVIERDFVAHLINALSQQVREHIGPHTPRLAPSIRVARRGDPDGKLIRNRARLCYHRMEAAILARKPHLFAAPQFAHGLKRFEQRGFVGRRRVLWPQDKVIRLPARGKPDARAPTGEVVDHRPFLGNAGRVVERGHTRARAHTDVAGHSGDSSARDRRVRVGATKGVEMPLRRPDRVKAMRVGKFRALKEQFVFLFARAVVIAPIIEVEVHLAITERDGAI